MDAIYNGSNSFRVFNNVTSEFVVGRRVKMDCGLDGLKYASVVSSSYSAPYTTVQIDESDLTAALTDVWYAVVTAGATGSIPDHLHDTSEGSGGQIASGVTLLGLDDTPATYSGAEGLYLRVDSTASGVEFSTVTGTDDHSHVAYSETGHTHATYVPWDFGAGTISGTGDIYCNDIYTASGTVYIGDLKLSTDGTNLLVDDQPIEATGGGEGGSTTFSGLADTPDVYDEGKYLRSTVSGTEWATVSGSPAEYVPWNFGSGTISGTGDIYCNDIYTSSGTVYIGTVKLSSDGETLLVNDAPVETVESTTVTMASGTPGGVPTITGDIHINLLNSGLYQSVDTGAYRVATRFNDIGMTHTESNHTNGTPLSLSDGNGSTYSQQSVGSNLWYKIDFGFENEAPIYKILLQGLSGFSTRMPDSFRVEASNNDSDWDIIHSDNGPASTGAAEYEFSAPSAAYRYWRLYIVSNHGDSLTVLTRIEYYEGADLDNYAWQQQGNMGSTTFSGLTDTPDTYDDGKYLRSTAAGTEWATVSGSGSWTYSTEATTTSGIIVTFDDIPSGVTSIEVMLVGVGTSTNTKPAIIQIGDAGGIETSGYDISNELGSSTFHTTDGWRTVIDSIHLSAMTHYGCLKLRKFIPSQNLWLGEYQFMTSGGNNVRYGSGFKTLTGELTSVALATSDGIATFTGGSATIRYK